MTGFVILHYKNIADTIDCIQSIQKIAGDKKIVVVDNHSLNKQEAKIIKKHDVDLVELDNNYGYAKANNIGCRYLINKYAPDYVAVLNNDIVITDSEFINKIITNGRKYNFDMLGTKIISKGDSVNPFPVIYGKSAVIKEIKRCKKLIRIYSSVLLTWLLKYYLFIKHIINKPQKISNGKKLMKGVALHGCAIIFSAKYLKKYDKPFYDETFLFHEEEFLYLRVTKNKLISIYDPNMEIIHKEGSSINTLNNSVRKNKLFKEKERIKSLKLLLKQY